MTENSLESLIDYYTYHGMPSQHNHFISLLGETQKDSFKVIYDIGSASLHWWKEAKAAFPNSDIYCFDAGDSFKPLYDYMQIPESHYHFGLLSDVNDTKSVQVRYADTEGVNIYPENCMYSGLTEADFVQEVRETKTLDTVVLEKALPPPDLIKMDIQGSELDVLKGGVLTVANAKAVILELPHVEYNIGAPDKETVIEYMESLGFKSHGCFCSNGPDGDYYFTR